MSALIKSYRVTCEGAPVQIEGWLHEGRAFYFRARHRGATLGLGKTIDDALYDSESVGVRIEGIADDRHPLSALADPVPLLGLLISIRLDYERWVSQGGKSQ